MDMQFAIGNSNQLFVKELAVLKHGSTIPNLYHFKPPYPREELDAKRVWQETFCYKKINGLQWCSGNIDYNQLSRILSMYKNYTVYVKGDQKLIFLQKYIHQANIIDLVDIPNLKSLKQFETYCEIHKKSPVVRCAVQNCVNVYLYMLINKIIE